MSVDAVAAAFTDFTNTSRRLFLLDGDGKTLLLSPSVDKSSSVLLALRRINVLHDTECGFNDEADGIFKTRLVVC